MKSGVLLVALLGTGLVAVATTTHAHAVRVTLHGIPTNLMLD